jgi:hypothetical protein
MKLIKSLLFIVLSIVICYLSWLLFYWLTPIIFKVSWFWLFVIFFIFGGFLIPLIGWLPGILAALINKLKSHSIIENIIVLLATLFFAISSCRLAWTYPASGIIAAIFQNMLALGIFWGIGMCLVSKTEY